jgi:hypothetical protein
MLTKKQVLSVVRDMPDNFDTTQLFDRILLFNKVEEGRKQIIDGGRPLNHRSQEKAEEMAEIDALLMNINKLFLVFHIVKPL